MPPAPHPISLIRRQAQQSGRGALLLEPALAVAPLLLPYSRRAARLLERIGLERPSLRLSGLLAELSAAGHKGIPAILVDKLAFALGEMFAARPPVVHQLPAPLVKLAAAVDELEKRTRALDPDAKPSARIARLTLDESPPAFFYAEGRGLDAVPSGLAVPLDGLARGALNVVSVRGPMLDVATRLTMIERIKDVIYEPIVDESTRLLAMLATGTVVKLALIHGGGLRIILRNRALADELDFSDAEEEPGRYLVLNAARAKHIVSQLALRDDVTIAWASVERWRTAKASARNMRVSLGERRDWLGLDGGVTLDDGNGVDVRELLAALREGRRYVVTRSGADEVLVALDDALVDALDPLAAAAPVGPALLGLVNAGARVDDSPAWRALLDANERARALDGEPPSTLRAELRAYQREGVRFLRRLATWNIGGVLADDMGLGKTVQSIAVLLDRAQSGPALVVAPTSVCFNWRDELAKFAPSLRVLRYEGPKRAALLKDVKPGDVVVASYAIVQRDAELLAPVAFATLILDEAQQVKNASTRRAKAIRALNAKWRVALTGTPLENHTGELWAIFDAVAPGLFGSWTEFKARFASPIEKEADVRRRRTLARAIAPFVLRRKKRDVAPELPPKTEVVQRLTLDANERRVYERVRQALLLDVLRPESDQPNEGERSLTAPERRVKILAAITRLRLVACHPSFADDVMLPPDHVEPAAKQRALVELLVELKEAGHRALVFSQFVRHLELARAAAAKAGITSLQLDGSTPGEARQELVARFQSGAVDAFFLSLKAGGTGLNLVRASYVVHLDPWWNPAVEDQATDRAHRIGQTEPVTVVRLVAEDTLEEEMLELHEHKRALVEGVLEGTAAAGALSVDELLALLSSTRRSARPADLVQESVQLEDDPR